MNILQLPTEISGQAYLTAKGLRDIGHHSINAARPNYYGYPCDYNLQMFKHGPFKQTFNPFPFFKWAKEFDVFHYHKSPMWPLALDLSYLHHMNKPFFVEFWGSDVRINQLELDRNPYYPFPKKSSKKQIRRLKFWADQTDEVIISDNSFDIFLEPYFKKIHIVRQRLDTDKYTPIYPNLETKIPRIIHAPNKQHIKGTTFLEKALASLKKKGLAFEYIQIENLTNTEALKAYATADIIVDQLRLGSHGIFACEGMALGKPVICYIHDSLLATYPEGFPIVNANPNTIEDVLEELILSPEKCHSIGKQSREYVERVHDIKAVANRLINVYTNHSVI